MWIASNDRTLSDDAVSDVMTVNPSRIRISRLSATSYGRGSSAAAKLTVTCTYCAVLAVLVTGLYRHATILNQ